MQTARTAVLARVGTSKEGMGRTAISVGISMVVRLDLKADFARMAEDLGYYGLRFPERQIWPAASDRQSP